MYSILVTLALCLAASGRPALENRQLPGHSIAGVAYERPLISTGIPCTNGNPAACFNGDITKCLFLPVNGTVTPACSTQEQTDLFSQAFGDINNIPTGWKFHSN
ncbi:hypothetical protein DFH08DRAFT_802202 [Mycena albidolilacea]|uniref:Uncharacterized protein n=1 Tax=Mycena albidolilacea TaxID=1033008 RepID=A0AAD7AGV4_9AGAR|nr:hypothetical protein DFH08DRAFT_802202 [Mycena albidolilacea]